MPPGPLDVRALKAPASYIITAQCNQSCLEGREDLLELPVAPRYITLKTYLTIRRYCPYLQAMAACVDPIGAKPQPHRLAGPGFHYTK